MMGIIIRGLFSPLSCPYSNLMSCRSIHQYLDYQDSHPQYIFFTFLNWCFSCCITCLFYRLCLTAFIIIYCVILVLESAAQLMSNNK